MIYWLFATCMLFLEVILKDIILNLTVSKEIGQNAHKKTIIIFLLFNFKFDYNFHIVF